MRWLLLVLSMLSMMMAGDAWSQQPGVRPQGGVVHQAGSGPWEPPTEGRDEGMYFVEMAVWSADGPPTISVNIMGEQITKRMQVTDVGVYSSTFRVPHSRLLPVELRTAAGQLFEDLIVLHHGDHRVSWMVTSDGRIQRSSSPVSSDSMAIQEALILGGGAMWILLVGLVLASGRMEKDGRKPLQWRLPEFAWLVIWLGLSIAFTWPSALSNNTMIVGRHFDAPGTLWVIGAAGRLFDSVDSLTAWPLGADISRLDSYLLIPIATLFKALGPGRIFGWIGIIGVALNAWAAQHFARAVGVRSPWTMLAGFGYGFCGMAATGLLEGHVYQVFNPWLPWFGAMLWKCTAADGTRQHTILAAVLFVLCWLTTAYVGIVALAMGLAVLWMSKRRPKGLVLGSLTFLVAYSLWYMHGDAQARESMEPLNPMSAHLAGLLAATPEIDRAEHSMAPIIFGWMLGLSILAFKVLPAGRWRALFWSGAGAVICSMIPKFAASPDFVLVPANLDWVAGPVAGMLRFPIRWAWLWSLCGGVVAAKVASTLAARWGRLGWLVLLVVVAEAFIRIGTPYRQEFRYIEAPTTLANRAGGVLDLFPVTQNRGENHDRWLSNFACVEQLAHGQPIAEDCVHTKPRRLRHDLNIWLQDRLLREQMEGVEATLAALGFKNVVLRPDLFTTQHASLMEAEMKSIDNQPTVVREKGVHALLFSLKGTQNQDIPTMLRDLKPPEQPRISRRQWIGGAHHGRFNGWVAIFSWLIIAGGLGMAIKKRR